MVLHRKNALCSGNSHPRFWQICLILWDADDVVDPAEPLDYFLQLNESIRHLHVFSGVGHYPNAQVPERLVGVFKRFITS